MTSTRGISSSATVTYRPSGIRSKVAAEIDGLLHGLVKARHNMLVSSIKVLGLSEHRQAENGIEPVTFRVSPSDDGMVTQFSTSLAQMDAARNRADGAVNGYSSPFNIWIDGTLMVHNRDDNRAKWGSFGLMNLGVDYLVSDNA